MSDETPQDDLPTETSSVETGVTEAEDQAADAGKNAELNREAVEDSVDSLSARIEEISARIDSLLPRLSSKRLKQPIGAADVNREASVNLKKGLGQIQAPS